MPFALYLSLLGISSVKSSKLDVYFKTKKLFNKLDPAMQEFIDTKLDLAFQVSSFPAPRCELWVYKDSD